MKHFLLLLCLTVVINAQPKITPLMLKQDTVLSNKLKEFVTAAGLSGDYNVGEDGIEQISLAVITMAGTEHSIGGVNPENFIYPASVYKMYVAAAVLIKAYNGVYALDSQYIVPAHNAVDGAREVLRDPRPLLHGGDTVTVQYLLDLMITRSDNSAANCLIDIATRPFINKLMADYGWKGSEVTRKFLKRKFEDPGYDTVRGTETCALHAAEFLYRAATGSLYNQWVSSKLLFFLGNQLDNTKLSGGLPSSAVFLHKTGWYSFWTNDTGIIHDGNTHYVIACFVPQTEEEAKPKMAALAKMIHNYLKEK